MGGGGGLSLASIWMGGGGGGGGHLPWPGGGHLWLLDDIVSLSLSQDFDAAYHQF